MLRRAFAPGIAALCILFAAVAVALAPLATAIAADAAAPAVPAQVSYYKQVRPILQEHCQGCHQPAKPLGGLVMTTVDAIVKGGESGAGLVAGKPDESTLVALITPNGTQPPEMPKGRPALTAAQIEIVRQWIAQGATNDTPPAAVDSIDAAHPPTYSAAPVVTGLDFSPDGSLLAATGYHEVLLHAANGDAVVARLVGLSERAESLAFSPDGKWLAVTGGSPGRFGEVQVWNVAERKLQYSLSLTFDTVYGVSWSHDSTKIAFGCADNTVRAIDAATGQQVLFQGAHADWVLDTVFSKDSSHLISVSRDRSMKLTEVATQRFVDNITSITPGALKGGLMTLTRHPTEDHLLVGGADGVPKIYQTYRTKARVIGDDFNLIREFAKMPGRIYAVAFSPDGKRIAAASSDDGVGEVRVYQTEDGQQLSVFAGQHGPVYALAYKPDGSVVASAGFDGQIRLNRPENGELVREFSAVPLSVPVAAAGGNGQ